MISHYLLKTQSFFLIAYLILLGCYYLGQYVFVGNDTQELSLVLTLLSLTFPIFLLANVGLYLGFFNVRRQLVTELQKVKTPHKKKFQRRLIFQNHKGIEEPIDTIIELFISKYGDIKTKEIKENQLSKSYMFNIKPVLKSNRLSLWFLVTRQPESITVDFQSDFSSSLGFFRGAQVLLLLNEFIRKLREHYKGPIQVEDI